MTAPSLRYQLSLGLALLLTSLLLVFSVFVFSAARSYLYGELDRHLHRDAETVQQSLSWDGRTDWQMQTIRHTEDDLFDTEPHFEVWSLSGQKLYQRSMPTQASLGALADLDIVFSVPEQRRSYQSVKSREADIRLGIESMQLTGSGGPHGVLIRVFRSEAALQSQLRALALGLAAATLAVVALGAALSAWLTQRALRPLGKLVVQVEAIGSTPANAPMMDLRSAGGSSEVCALGVSFSQMLVRLEASHAQLDGFAADCAHELRTPLAALRAQGEQLLASAATPAQSQSMADMLESTDRMTVLINRLLGLARAESNVQTLELQALDLMLVARQTADILMPVLEENGQTLTLAGKPSRALADATWLQHIVMDLLHNSTRYAPPGSRVTLRVWQDGPEAVLSVEDQGHGLSQAVRQRTGIHLLTPSSATGVELACTIQHPDSTCLGLVIAARLAKLQGGRLTARRLSESGNAVDVRLALAQGKHCPCVKAPELA